MDPESGEAIYWVEMERRYVRDSRLHSEQAPREIHNIIFINTSHVV